jgi:hypothetical protein
MKQLALILGFGLVVGYTFEATRSHVLLAQQPAQRPAAAPPHMPPVPNPPLYPDPPERPRHWTAAELQKMFQARLAYARTDPNGNPRRGAAPGTTFQGQSFRTHSIQTNFRWKYPIPRVSAFARVTSQDDDGDQHQTLTDFCVFFGGRGQMRVDGVIQNRVYGSKAGPGGQLILMPGEMNGQPIVGGQTFNVQSGDWVSVPPNMPHQYIAEPNEGLAYLFLKVYLGFDHPALSY